MAVICFFGDRWLVAKKCYTDNYMHAHMQWRSQGVGYWTMPAKATQGDKHIIPLILIGLINLAVYGLRVPTMTPDGDSPASEGPHAAI